MFKGLSKALLLNCQFRLPVVAADWREYRSESFIIYSDARTRSVEALPAVRQGDKVDTYAALCAAMDC